MELGRIVDDVMGPGPEEQSGHTPSSSFSSWREADWSAGLVGMGLIIAAVAVAATLDC